ncbi:MAG: hypothetical protein Q9163_005414, partial [Psora crenata]
VLEHPAQGTQSPILQEASGKRLMLRLSSPRQEIRAPRSPRMQSISRTKTRTTSRKGIVSEPPSPNLTVGRETSNSFSDLRANIAFLWSPRTTKSARTTPGLNVPLMKPQIAGDHLRVSLRVCEHIPRFNNVFTLKTVFLSAPLPSVYCSAPMPNLATQALKRAPLEKAKPNHLERLEADDKALRSPQREQYKVYLFERILLCCKEINPNKPKNKMLGNNKPLVDKKGQPKLQLKGRIFLQNVTDVLTFKRIEKSSYTVQIFWKGEPGVENFVIRFSDEKTMTEWQEMVQKQKNKLSDAARKSGQNSTSATEFSYMRNQPRPPNPYHEADDLDDDEEHSSHAARVPGKPEGSERRNASNTSLRSMGGQPGGNRMQYTRLPPEDQGNAHFGPSLSLNTSITPGGPSPGEFAAQSYFSPTMDSPISTRSSSQASMYGFSRQQAPHPGWSYENGKHRTAPAMPRAPSREGPPPSTRPSLPAMATAQHPGSQLSQNPSRHRSASTPDINGPGPRRQPNGQLQSPDNIPVPPIPYNVRVPINRSQTTSPFDAQLPIRGATQSPAIQQPSYDNHGQRIHSRHDIEPSRQTTGEAASKISPLSQTNMGLTIPSDRDSMYPSQLKVKVFFNPAPSHVTIVVPITIKYRTLIDRIDSKMVRISSASIAGGSARLKYKDRDNDLIVIKTDEDVGDAIEEWGAVHEPRLRQGITDDFELFWQEKPERA